MLAVTKLISMVYFLLLHLLIIHDLHNYICIPLAGCLVARQSGSVTTRGRVGLGAGGHDA